MVNQANDKCGGQTEMTVREATIFSLEKSVAEFENMKKEFAAISDKFDAGADHEALVMVRDNVVNKVTPLLEFCFTLTHIFDDVVDAPLRERLEVKMREIDKLMGKLGGETERANFSEVGDLLRFDFTDILTEVAAMFPAITQCFRDSEVERLNEY